MNAAKTYVVTESPAPFAVETTEDFRVSYYLNPFDLGTMIVAAYNRRTTVTTFTVDILPKSMR